MAARAIFITVVFLTAAGGVSAGEKPLSKAGDLIKQAVAAYTALDYDKALPLLAEAERQPNLGESDRITILKYRAFIHILGGRDILAHGVVASIYRIQPDFELPDTVSPKFRNFFADVKKEIKPRTIEAKPVVAPPPPGQRVAEAVPEKPNLFFRFWPSWTCFAVGAGFLIPGAVVGLDVNSGREELQNAPKDAAGRIPGMTYEDAKAIQNDADRKALTANILLGTGAAVVITGAVMFFVYDGDWRIGAAGTRTSVSVETDGAAKLVKAGWAF
jgi:hypothetical protein